MILLRKAYRGHYIEIRPVATGAEQGTVGEARIWIDGEPMALAFPCRHSDMLPSLLKVATDAIDRDASMRA